MSVLVKKKDLKSMNHLRKSSNHSTTSKLSQATQSRTATQSITYRMMINFSILQLSYRIRFKPNYVYMKSKTCSQLFLQPKDINYHLVSSTSLKTNMSRIILVQRRWKTKTKHDHYEKQLVHFASICKGPINLRTVLTEGLEYCFC